MKKKNILFVIDSLGSGGAEKSLTSLLSVLNLEKYEVDLLLINKTGLYIDLIPPKVNIIELEKVKSSFISKLLFSVILRIKRLLLKIIKSYKFHPAQNHWKYIGKNYIAQSKEYDVAIAYSQGLPTYYVSSKIKAVKKYCWINTDYNIAGYNPKIDKMYYAAFDKIILVSKKAAEVFNRIFPNFKNTQIIYDIISEKMVLELSNFKIDSELSKSTIKILTIGRLVPIKGYDFVLEAALKLKENNIDFKWSIIGEGILKDELQRQVKLNKLEMYIEFLGVFANPYPYIHQCDIYCQPSRFEGFGMAIAEAKILNKPIVATNFEIIHNQIIDKQNGLIVEMTGDAVFNGLNELIKNKTLYNSIIENLNRERVDTASEIIKVEQLIEA